MRVAEKLFGQTWTSPFCDAKGVPTLLPLLHSPWWGT